MRGPAEKRRYPAGLFDLPQDLARGLPLDLVENWVRSDQTLDSAAEILARTIVRGTTVVSDSVGLTRLARERRLIEILALINRPKELIHSYGKVVGGQAVGIWAADNTQMWYPEDVAPRQILSMLLTVQDRIVTECEVWVGLGAHSGQFYSISGGLYGPEADGIEEIAENQTEGGEILVSERLAGRLGDRHGFSLQLRSDVSSHIGHLLRLTNGPRLERAAIPDPRYPVPYSGEFYAALLKYQQNPKVELLNEIEERFTQERAVVLVERARREAASTETAVLEDLALSVLMRKVGAELLEPTGTEIKVTGTLGIYIFTECSEALRFAQRFRSELALADVDCRIGVDCGPILVCELLDGGKDISGMPVNIASKMAQDAGKMNGIYLTKAVAERTRPAAFVPITLSASGIEIEAFEG